MNCLKCGREITAGQVFCDGCLEVMAQYPVKPDAAIHLPHRPGQTAPKKAASRKRQLQPEEQVILLQRRCRRLLASLLLCIVLLAVSVVVTLHFVPGDQVVLPIGRNYTIDPNG